jgi:hypothetical protein
VTKRINLTARQREVLEHLNKIGVRAVYMRPFRMSEEPYWFISNTMQRCTRQIERLIVLKLVTFRDGNKWGSDRDAVINDAGRAVLVE